MRYLVALFMTLAFAVQPAFANKKADPQAEPPIKSGTEITVSGYNPQFKVFLVAINATPAIGPNYAAAGDLHKALEHEGSLKDFIKNKYVRMYSCSQRKCQAHVHASRIIFDWGVDKLF